MFTLSIDLGARRIGLALSDQGARLATPLLVLEVSSPAAALAAILQIIRKHAVQRIVLGLPLNMDDTFGPAARRTIAFGHRLAAAAALPLLFVDERLSTFQARQQLISRKQAGEKLTRRKKKRRLDALAAADFLQAFLDGRLRPITPP
jgi:putative Holliday junction resolvase